VAQVVSRAVTCDEPTRLKLAISSLGKDSSSGELPAKLAGHVALEAAANSPSGLSLGSAPGNEGACTWAAAHPDQRDGVDGAVNGPATATVEPVPDGMAAAGRDRAGAPEGSEHGLAAAPA
jgi:hypothetical protein